MEKGKLNEQLIETNNGAISNISTGSEVLNMFSSAGSMRTSAEKIIKNLIDGAWNDDRDMALRAIFYLGDIRKGQGERRFFKIALNYLIENDPEIAKQLIAYIPEYSRWDLTYEFEGSDLESDMFEVVKTQFETDMKALSNDEGVSLLGKWLKSINTSSKESRRLGRKTAEALGLDLDSYRKALSKLREKLNVVEKKMCAKEWAEIDLNTVPGNAFKRYSTAFGKHIPEKLTEYLGKVESGEIKMKSSVLYPYDILAKAIRSQHNSSEEKVAELQWRDLPDYMDGNDEFIIPVIDTSGSMDTSIGSGNTTAMMAAVSIGMYVSERMAGPFKNKYITFSSKPVLGTFTGNTLKDKYRNMRSIVDNTNIEAVFDIILRTAIANSTPQEDMPSKILILSDMQFDGCVSTNSSKTNGWYSRGASNSELKTLFQEMKDRFANAGYALPDVYFWNMNSSGGQFPVSQHESGAALVSGFSPSILKALLAGNGLTPMEIMMSVLDNQRYAHFSELFDLPELDDDEESSEE